MEQLIILLENTTEREDLAAEHGLSIYIETEHHKIIADTGASDRTWENAEKLGVDLSAVDTIVLSHGHYDHSGGLLSLAAECPDASIYMQKSAGNDYYHGERYIGIDKEILRLPGLHLLEGGIQIDDGLEIFSEMTGNRNRPEGNKVLSEKINGELVQDDFLHEQCLAVRYKGKNLLISGCAHNGILNILDRYRELYGTDPDVVISGFHMMKDSEYTQEETETILETARELCSMPTVFYSGHCTSQPAFDLMKKIMKDQLLPIHSGDRIELQ